MLNIGVLGCQGRMGRLITAEILQTPECAFSGGSVKTAQSFDREFEFFLKALNNSSLITPNSEQIFSVSQVIIDFTTAGATLRHLELAQRYKVPLVIGTTGISREDDHKITKIAKEIPLLQDFNTSLGHTLMVDLVEKMADILDESYDIEIFEMHHSRKKDAPSGSSLNLGKAAARGRGIPFPENIDANRNRARQRGEIGFSVARGGNVTGDHSVIFAGEKEMLTLSHRAFSPALFAQGAVKAARWLVDQKPGRYRMRDVLALSFKKGR